MVQFFYYGLLGVLLWATGISSAHAQLKVTAPEIHRLLIVWNTSPEDYATSEGKNTSIRDASMFIKSLADALYHHNAEVELALASSGHLPSPQRTRCTEISQLVPFSRDNKAQMGLRLDDIVHSKKTINAWDLQSIQKLMTPDSRFSYRYLIITPLAEDCYIPPCSDRGISQSESHTGDLFVYYSSGLKDCPGQLYSFDAKKEGAAIIQEIVQQYPRLISTPEPQFAGRSQERKSDSYLGSNRPEKNTPDSAPFKTPSSPEEDMATPKEIPAVQFTGKSKMRSSEVYGTIQFQISRPVPVIYLFKDTGKGEFKPDQEVFTLGLNRIKVQLPPGNYRAVYHPEGLGWNKEFEVKVGEVIGLWLR